MVERGLAPRGKKWVSNKFGESYLVDVKPGKSSNPFGSVGKNPDPYTAWLMNVKSQVEAKKPDSRHVDWHDEGSVQEWRDAELSYAQEYGAKKAAAKKKLLGGQPLFLESYDPLTRTIIKTRNPLVTKDMLLAMPKHYWSKVELSKALGDRKVSNAVSMEIHALGPLAVPSFASWFNANYPQLKSVKKEHVLLWLQDLPNKDEKYRKTLERVANQKEERIKRPRQYTGDEEYTRGKRRKVLEEIRRVTAESRAAGAKDMVKRIAEAKVLMEASRRKKINKQRAAEQNRMVVDRGTTDSDQ